MKEKNATSPLKRVLLNCSSLAKDYGSCVAAKVSEIQRDACLKEFLALKNCMQNSLRGRPIPGSRGLYYDDANKLLLSATSDQVFSWKTVPFSPDTSLNSDSIGEGPILSVRYSLDAKLIAIQRSSQEIQFWNRETGETFSHRSKLESENILGFFWTDCPLCNFVLVKISGLDLLACNPETKSLQLVETRKMNVCWYIYTHESRLVLLATGMQCKTFTGYQLSSAGIIRLPRFEMVMAKSEANSKPVLAAEDVHIVTVYGRIYCLQLDRVSMQLHSYRFYRDAVVQQGSLPIYSSKIAVSVVDNVLLVHQVDAKVVILYDIHTDSRAPISAPLPLLFRGFPRSSFSRANSTEGGNSEANSNHNEATIYGDEWTFLVPDLVCDVASKLLWKIHLDLEAIAASSSEVPSVIEFLQRRKLEASKAKELCLSMMRTVILERRPVTMVTKAIDALVTSYSNSIKSGSHLRGNKVEKTPTGVHVGGHSSGLDATAGAGVDKESANRSSNFSSDSEENSQCEIDSNGRGPQKVERENTLGAESSSTDIHPSSSQSQHLGPGYNPLNAGTSERQESQLTSAAISPDEMYSSVFAPVDEEMSGDSCYLIAILVEFFRSTSLEKIKVHPNLFVLTIQLLAHNQRFAELTLFVINKVLEPSKEVAMQILESGRSSPQIRKLGLDMLRQLSLHHDYVVQLVQDGYYLEALRYARKHKVITVRPSLFLEAALASNDSQVLAAVIRFFSDFTPGFRSTSDYHTYFRILNEMNNTVAA